LMTNFRVKRVVYMYYVVCVMALMGGVSQLISHDVLTVAEVPLPCMLCTGGGRRSDAFQFLGFMQHSYTIDQVVLKFEVC